MTKCDRNLPFMCTDDTPDPKGIGWVADVAVGDLDSDAKGSGARKNAGKLSMELAPASWWVTYFNANYSYDSEVGPIMYALAGWHERGSGFDMWVDMDFKQVQDMLDVLEMGAEKYRPWNWAKGMKWSVCVGCILRHIHAHLSGEEFDEESGLRHIAHAHANAMFLNYFYYHYPEGDDRPPSLEDEA